jgi:hypothetical protein
MIFKSYDTQYRSQRVFVFFFLKEQEGQSPSYYILKETDKTMVQKTQPMADRKGSHPIEYTYKPF